mgnify:FL=1
MILITGGLGYLGGRIANHLIQKQDTPIVLGVKDKNFKLPDELRNCKVIQLNVLSASDLKAACNGVTSIVHLAALNFQESQKDPQKASLINTEGTYELLRSAVKTGVKKFIYFSTAHVYRSPLEGNIDETTKTLPGNPYASSHLEAEKHVLKFHSDNNINGIVFRLSNAIGRPMDKNVNCWMLAANNFCKQAILNQEIVLKGDPYQQRDFIPISHIERLTEEILDSSKIGYYGKVMNVGSEKSLSLLDLAKKISNRCKVLFGYEPKLIQNQESDKKTNDGLNYNCKDFKGLNIFSEKTLEDEIDELLKFCKNFF